MYQGKPLSRWLNYRTALKPMPRKIQEQEADDAVRQVGTNALSTLLRMLRAKESRWKTELMYWAQRQPIITIDYTCKRRSKRAAGVTRVTGLGTAWLRRLQ